MLCFDLCSRRFIILFIYIFMHRAIMKVGILFSGGKDSCLALHLAREQGYNLGCLICIEPENKDSFMFHTPL